MPRSKTYVDIIDIYNKSDEILYGKIGQKSLLEKLLARIYEARTASTHEESLHIRTSITMLGCKTIPPILLDTEGLRTMCINRKRTYGYILVEALGEIVKKL